MANDFYNASGSPSVGSQGSSAIVRGELASIEAAFDKFPALTSDAFIITNTSGTGYTPITGKIGVAWTPTFTFSSPGNLSVAYSTRVGVYSRVGEFVLATFRIVTSSFTHTTASGLAQITGLGITSKTFSVAEHRGILYGSGFTSSASYTNFACLMGNGSNYFVLVQYDFTPAIDITPLTATQFPTGGTVSLRGCVAFMANGV